MLFREVIAIYSENASYLNGKEGDANDNHCILSGLVLHSDVTFNIFFGYH
jgi:hypothetical protein